MALRCIHCGDVVDRVIAHNREQRHHPARSRARTPIYGGSRLKQRKPVLTRPGCVC